MTTPTIPIVLCAGENGRCLLYGRVTERPVPGSPVTLHGARMCIYYPSGGALGLAAHGPPKGSRLSATVPETMETVWQEWMLCTDQAAQAWESFRGE